MSRVPKLRLQEPVSVSGSLADRPIRHAQTPAQAPKATPAKPAQPSPEDLFGRWKQDPSPENGARLLQSLEPHIAASARKYGRDDNPVLFGRAKSLVIDALPRYDAHRGASLATFVDRQLQPLQRWQARKNIGVRLPTRDIQLRRQLEGSATQLEDDLGRSPSIQELADSSGVPLETIQRLNRQQYPQVAEREMLSADGSPMVAGDQAVASSDLDLWQRAVYHDLEPVDQFIMQHTWGIYGAPPLSTATIAKRLKITPGAVSQRRAKIDAYLKSVE